MPNTTMRVLLRILKPDRKPTSRETRRELMQQQDGKCAKCGREDSLEADHVHPISKDPFGRNDNAEDLELLCEECHLEKTVAQVDDRDFNPLLSYVNTHTPGTTSSCRSRLINKCSG